MGMKIFKKLKERRYLQRRAQIEILETLCTICMYLEREGYDRHNPLSKYMNDHFVALKELSRALRSMKK